MKIKPITERKKEIIKANYPEYTILELSKMVNINYTRIRLFLKENNLVLSIADAQTLRRKKAKEQEKLKTKKALSKDVQKPKSFWIPNPWDKNLNLITMQRPL